MTEPTPDPILLEPGQNLPADVPAGTAVYVRVDGAMLADGCLGQHYPDTNPNCTGA
jgi:hypothetical protein